MRSEMRRIKMMMLLYKNGLDVFAENASARNEKCTKVEFQ